MQFAKVFDRDPRTVSLRNLLVKAKADPEQLIPNAGEEELKQIGTQIDTNEAVLERLKGLRDQRIAHHDAHPAKELSLLHGDLTRLVEEIKSMYNSLERGHNRESTFFENLTHDAERHTSEVVRIMREDRDRAIRRVNETNTAQSI